jgi:hypothetical protein
MFRIEGSGTVVRVLHGGASRDDISALGPSTDRPLAG